MGDSLQHYIKEGYMYGPFAGLWDNREVELDMETLKSFKWWKLNLMALFHGGLDITDSLMKAFFLVGVVEIFPGGSRGL